MEYFRKSGKTVLFVSHDPQLVQRFCTHAVWIEGGKVAMTGKAREVVTAYQAFCAKLEDQRLRDAARNGGIASREHDAILRELQLTGSRWGSGKIRFTGIEMINSRGEQTWVFSTGEAATIRLQFESDADYPRPVFAVDIHRYDGVFIGSINNLDTHPALLPIKRGAGVIDLRISKLELSHNVYFLSLKTYTEDGAPEWNHPAEIHNQMYQLDVVSEKAVHGLVRFDAEWDAAADLTSFEKKA
jgi:hypothetical protein